MNYILSVSVSFFSLFHKHKHTHTHTNLFSRYTKPQTILRESDLCYTGVRGPVHRERMKQLPGQTLCSVENPACPEPQHEQYWSCSACAHFLMAHLLQNCRGTGCGDVSNQDLCLWCVQWSEHTGEDTKEKQHRSTSPGQKLCPKAQLPELDLVQFFWRLRPGEMASWLNPHLA